MVEIKISISEEMDDLIQRACDSLGIKKTEYIKYLVIGNLKELNEIKLSKKEVKNK